MNTYRWSNLAVGMSAAFEASFSPEQAAAFAALSGDVNALHLDEEAARAAGFDAPLLHGMLAASLYSTLAGVHLPGRYALLHGVDVHFHAPCFPGEVLRCEGTIVELSPAFERIEIKAAIHKPDGRIASRARLRVGLQSTAPQRG